jgi:hypothetical protein
MRVGAVAVYCSAALLLSRVCACAVRLLLERLQHELTSEIERAKHRAL